jgi:hypothetical protein
LAFQDLRAFFAQPWPTSSYYTIYVGFGIFWIALPTSSTRLPRRVREFPHTKFLVTCNSFFVSEPLRLSRIRMITVVSVLKAPQSTEITSTFWFCC